MFLGDTLEQAMAFAVAALGPDLTVRRARKVRRGVQGLVGKDRYEVLAVPVATSPGVGGAVASAFDALLEQAEQQEVPRHRRTTRPAQDVHVLVAPAAPHPAPEIGEHQELLALLAPAAPALVAVEPAPPEPVLPLVPSSRATAEDVAPAAAEKPTPPAPPVRRARTPATPAPPAEPRAAAKTTSRTSRAKAPRAPRPVAAPPTGWSRATLVHLGLPAQVLAALPAVDPVGDLAWAAALADALATVLPEPQSLSEQHAVVVDGHGLQGVLGIVQAAALGLTPGTITSAGRTVPATPSELALVVRAAVLA